MDDDVFLGHVADRLGDLPGVEAVTLGGSRAEKVHRPDSDWDFSIYYRSRFDPQTLRDIGWPGEVSEVGGWSKGVFNGGAWLEIDGRRSDVHYRDLDVIDREIAAAGEGRFCIEPLMFHLAGIPSYLLLAELAVKKVLRGQLPTPEYPVALRKRAPQVWWTGPRGRSGMRMRTMLRTGVWPNAPDWSARPHLRRHTRCWRDAASGSPMRRGC